MSEQSTIGVRSEWRCAACGQSERVYQVIGAADPVLDVPAGWTVTDARTYCPEHIRCRIAQQLFAAS